MDDTAGYDHCDAVCVAVVVVVAAAIVVLMVLADDVAGATAATADDGEAVAVVVVVVVAFVEQQGEPTPPSCWLQLVIIVVATWLPIGFVVVLSGRLALCSAVWRHMQYMYPAIEHNSRAPNAGAGCLLSLIKVGS